MNTDQLLDKLTEAVSFKYKEDQTSPSVLVSRLKTGYYCSVVRYGGAFARDKQVICSARGTTLQTTLKTLASDFVKSAGQVRDPIQELGALVNL